MQGKKINNIIKEYFELTKEKEERKIGRYFASEIRYILEGKIKPKDFFQEKENSLDEIKMMLTGKEWENIWTKIFEKTNIDFEAQVKKELDLTEEIKIVSKPDFVFKNFIIETKFPFITGTEGELLERYSPQLECYYRTFQKDVYLGIIFLPLSLKLIKYTPSDYKWKKIKEAVFNFHEELKKVVS